MGALMPGIASCRASRSDLRGDFRSLAVDKFGCSLCVSGGGEHCSVKLSNKIIDDNVEMPNSRTFWYRFGGLRRACELIGYDWRKNGRQADEEMLQHLRSLLVSHGRLSKPIIDAEPRLVSSHKLRRRFGRVDRAYELIGYDWKKDLSKARRRV